MLDAQREKREAEDLKWKEEKKKEKEEEEQDKQRQAAEAAEAARKEQEEFDKWKDMCARARLLQIAAICDGVAAICDGVDRGGIGSALKRGAQATMRCSRRTRGSLPSSYSTSSSRRWGHMSLFMEGSRGCSCIAACSC